MHSAPSPSRRLRALFRWIRGLYFRDVWTVGAMPPEGTRGTVFVANHPNGLLDPVVVLTEIQCHAAPLAKSTLWQVPVLKQILNAAGAVPVLRKQDTGKGSDTDNDAMFARVSAHLAGGGNILLFPEGISHDEHRLLELRSGAARMLAKAWEAGGRDLGFVPIALHYDAKDLFRSRVLMACGNRSDASVFSGSEGSLDVRALKDAMHADMRVLMVESPDTEAFECAATYAEIQANETDAPSAEQAYAHALTAAGAHHTAGLRAYTAALRSADVTDTDLCNLHRSAEAPASLFWRMLGWLGVLAYLLPYKLVHPIAARTADGGRDVMSTYKLGVGAIVFVGWWLLLVAACFVALPWPVAVSAAVLFTLAPFAALSVLDDPARKLRARGMRVEALWSMRPSVSR